ncbi:YoaK family protein [Lentilactobacillus sp. SPB1-3]|uniref:YoaK family protein n=1 Tax=Lentilactobacillus terminaliae TaxID=3003483 RepID=A0ACD5DEG0_9LACO|nr:YoaK family protein [Lentilactobacillus sp. SPB1-3]MCZ0977551.1 YoaK family protein [Lentilactobacillus sp. SPB1-3]
MEKDEEFYQKLFAGMMLAATAGALDAYSYLYNGGVFAGLQTGNLILMGIHIGSGQFSQAGLELFSAVMFMLGVFIMRVIQQHYPSEIALKRQELTLIYEIIMFAAVAFLAPVLPRLIITGLLSIAAAAQLQEFRMLKGKPFTSLMMTGNIRTFAESGFDFLTTGDQKARATAGKMSLILLSFVIGAVLSGFFLPYLGAKTILISAGILLITLIFGR